MFIKKFKKGFEIYLTNFILAELAQLHDSILFCKVSNLTSGQQFLSVHCIRLKFGFKHSRIYIGSHIKFTVSFIFHNLMVFTSIDASHNKI